MAAMAWKQGRPRAAVGSLSCFSEASCWPLHPQHVHPQVGQRGQLAQPSCILPPGAAALRGAAGPRLAGRL
jgi:hypothetical protein